MKELLTKHFNNFRDERIMSLADSIYNYDEGYQRFLLDANSIEEQLESLLTEEQSRLLNRLSELQTRLQAISEEKMYSSGLSDGLRLGSLIGRL